MDGGDPTKGGSSHKEKAELKSKRGKLAEMHLAKRISVEYREEVHEKLQRKMRHLLWDGTQIEEGGNGRTVQ